MFGLRPGSFTLVALLGAGGKPSTWLPPGMTRRSAPPILLLNCHGTSAASLLPPALSPGCSLHFPGIPCCFHVMTHHHGSRPESNHQSSSGSVTWNVTSFWGNFPWYV